MKKQQVMLLDPRFDQPIIINTSFEWRFLLFGPYSAFRDGHIFFSLMVIMLSICTLGLYWLYYSFNANKIEIRHKVNFGYRPASTEDANKVKSICKQNSLNFEDIKFGRLGTAESEFLKRF